MQEYKDISAFLVKWKELTPKAKLKLRQNPAIVEAVLKSIEDRPFEYWSTQGRCGNYHVAMVYTDPDHWDMSDLNLLLQYNTEEIWVWSDCTPSTGNLGRDDAIVIVSKDNPLFNRFMACIKKGVLCYAGVEDVNSY